MERFTIYTTRWCGYCVRAKALLDSRGIPYEEIQPRRRPGLSSAPSSISPGGWTVPQILIDGKPIGGYVELWRLDRDGSSNRLPA